MRDLLTAAVDALRKLAAREMREQLEAADKHIQKSGADAVITHAGDMIGFFHPNFWLSMFHALVPAWRLPR